jgi:hypothetical protein
MNWWHRAKLWVHALFLRWGLTKKTRLPPPPKKLDARLDGFAIFVEKWIEGFGDYTYADQPDRLHLMQEFGFNPANNQAITAIYDAGGLQRAVYLVLTEKKLTVNEAVTDKQLLEDRIYLSDQLAANMTQVSFAGCPELGTQYIYGESWKKGLQS